LVVVSSAAAISILATATTVRTAGGG
jgi:hypothetical protein